MMVVEHDHNGIHCEQCTGIFPSCQPIHQKSTRRTVPLSSPTGSALRIRERRGLLFSNFRKQSRSEKGLTVRRMF
jgi:hypothetical protein